jgi:hypothetical protein
MRALLRPHTGLPHTQPDGLGRVHGPSHHCRVFVGPSKVRQFDEVVSVRAPRLHARSHEFGYLPHYAPIVKFVRDRLHVSLSPRSSAARRATGGLLIARSITTMLAVNGHTSRAGRLSRPAATTVCRENAERGCGTSRIPGRCCRSGRLGGCSVRSLRNCPAR